jgi:hypothetical protein
MLRRLLLRAGAFALELCSHVSMLCTSSLRSVSGELIATYTVPEKTGGRVRFSYLLSLSPFSWGVRRRFRAISLGCKFDFRDNSLGCKFG